MRAQSSRTLYELTYSPINPPKAFEHVIGHLERRNPRQLTEMPRRECLSRYSNRT